MFGPEPNCGIHEENPFCDVPLYPISRSKPYDQLGCFKRTVRSYQGLDEDADKYVEKVKAIIGDEGPFELERVRQAMVEIKCPKKLDISLFYRLNGRLPHEDLDYDYALDYEVEKVLIYLYNTFYNESIRLLGRVAGCRTNILYHLLKKIGKEPNTDHFQLMKEANHQRTEEEIEFIFEH